MNKFLALGIALFLSANLFGQISASDSTVQVIGYWAKHEKQSFDITYDKYKIQNSDTLSRELIKYQVDVTIQDSTADSYTIEWFYRNFSVETDNQLTKKLMSVTEDVPVVIKTNEMGTILEVVNWQQVRDYIQKSADAMKKEMKGIPNAEQIIAQVIGIYVSEESIKANAIKDAQQFYTFHGAKYKLGQQLTGQMQLMNNYGGKPFDTDVSVMLDEIKTEEGNAVIRMYQQVNSEQLTDATYEFLKKMGTFGNQFPARDKFPPLSNEIWTASRIHGDTGWTIYSIETKKVAAEGVTNIEERIIEIK